MRTGRLVLLAIVVLGLGAYIALVERKAPTTDERREQEGKLFPGFDQAKARRVVITNSHGRFELVKEKDVWTLKAPLADQANQGSVSSLLYSLGSLKADRTFKAGEVKLSDYGLDKPPLSVTVEDDAGKAYSLKLGAEMPLGNSRAALTTTDAVCLVNKFVASDLDKDLAGWRSDELAQVYSTDVASLTLASPSGQVALAHTASAWTITSPEPDLADRDRAEGLLTDISGARIKEFLDTAPDLKALGLEPRRFGLTIVRRGANAAPIVLDFGSERDVKDGKQVACKRGERVFWVDAKAASRLAGPWQEWRSKKLVEFDSWGVDKLELEVGSSKAALERKDGIWKAGATEVDGEAVSQRLETLADLQVISFDRPKPSGAPLGRVKLSGEGVSVDAAFYPGGSAGEDVATVGGRTGGLAVDAAKVKGLLSDPAALAKPKPTATPTPKPKPTDASPARK
ncbi:MAG TPA: DUF4340 domain-containing protein [Thermoanaerobaculaceae bacterium]|nr:DUF4340 domain-containing protein [Thermoanaerobaculaceae bacterium]